MSENTDQNESISNATSIMEVLIRYATQSNFTNYKVREYSLLGIRNVVVHHNWMTHPNHSLFVDSLLLMLKTLLAQHSAGKEPNTSRLIYIRSLALNIACQLASVPAYQLKLCNRLTDILVSIVFQNNPQITSDKDDNTVGLLTPQHIIYSLATLTHLSNNLECIHALLNKFVIEACVHCVLYPISQLQPVIQQNQHCQMALTCISNLCTVPHIRVLNGRRFNIDHGTHEQSNQFISDSVISHHFDLTILHDMVQKFLVGSSLSPYKTQEQLQQTPKKKPLNSEIHLLIAIIAARISAHTDFELEMFDLVYFDSILSYLSLSEEDFISSRQAQQQKHKDNIFVIQLYSLMALSNLLKLCQSSNQLWSKMFFDNSNKQPLQWIPVLLCHIQSTDQHIQNLVIECLALIVTHTPPNPNANTKLIPYLESLLGDIHFISFLQLPFEQQIPVNSLLRMFSVYNNIFIRTLYIKNGSYRHKSDNQNNVHSTTR